MIVHRSAVWDAGSMLRAMQEAAAPGGVANARAAKLTPGCRFRREDTATPRGLWHILARGDLFGRRSAPRGEQWSQFTDVHRYDYVVVRSCITVDYEPDYISDGYIISTV